MTLGTNMCAKIPNIASESPSVPSKGDCVLSFYTNIIEISIDTKRFLTSDAAVARLPVIGRLFSRWCDVYKET